MTDTEIHGFCPAKFAPVREAFAANFAEDRELGARFAVAIEGEVLVDLWAGFADRARTQAFDERTLTPVFSTTKAMASLLIARLVDQGKLAYGQRVAEVWPEFAQAGKQDLTVEQVLSHQGGLPGFAEEFDAALWFDWGYICAKLAAMAPMWPPGRSGYHPVTFGYLAGEIFRRVDGRTMGAALREDIAEPFDLDLWLGLPDSEHPRAASLQRPPALPDLGEITEPKRVAFLTPWAAPGGRGTAEWRRFEIPSANGHATAPALARMMAVLACDGSLDEIGVLSSGMAAEAARERVSGDDLVLPFWMSWGAGFMRNTERGLFGPGANSFGHYGWGGSCAMADPERRLSMSYVMNRQSNELVGDARAVRLIEAAYAALG